MNFRFARKALLLGLFIFAIIGTISIFKSFSTSLTSKESASEAEVYAPDVDIPYLDEPADHLELISLGGWNTVMCWPSVGGIIVNTHVSSVELDFLKLPRFESAPRSYNTSEEDEFCRQLRRTGAKWWESYWDFADAVDAKLRPTSAKERETLLLGWPEDGGVWILKEADWYDFSIHPGIWRMTNAHTMEERCKAMKMSGAVYYKNPEDCESVKPLLSGFGEHEREETSKYYFDSQRDFHCKA